MAVDYTSPRDLLAMLEESENKHAGAGQEESYRSKWATFSDFIAAYLRHIAPAHPDIPLATITASQIALVMERNETEGEVDDGVDPKFPILARDVFRSGVGTLRAIDYDVQYTVIDEPLNRLSIVAPCRLPETAVTFLKDAFSHVRGPHRDAVALRRANFRNAVTKFPSDDALTAYLENWAHDALRKEQRDGVKTPETLLFSGDIAMFHFINKVVGRKEGDRLLYDAGNHIIRYSRNLARTNSGVTWYFSNPSGDEYVWVYHGMPSASAKYIADPKEPTSLAAYFNDHPFSSRRIDTRERFSRPFIMPVGWVTLAPEDVLNDQLYAAKMADADNNILRHKPDARARALRVYPESRLFSRPE